MTHPAGENGEAVDVFEAAALGGAAVLDALGVTATAGLSTAEVDVPRRQWGPNTVASHRARLLPVFGHQLRSPLLALGVSEKAIER